MKRYLIVAILTLLLAPSLLAHPRRLREISGMLIAIDSEGSDLTIVIDGSNEEMRLKSSSRVEKEILELKKNLPIRVTVYYSIPAIGRKIAQRVTSDGFSLHDRKASPSKSLRAINSQVTFSPDTGKALSNPLIMFGWLMRDCNGKQRWREVQNSLI